MDAVTGKGLGTKYAGKIIPTVRYERRVDKILVDMIGKCVELRTATRMVAEGILVNRSAAIAYAVVDQDANMHPVKLADVYAVNRGFQIYIR